MLTTPPAARLLVLVPNGDLPVVELAQRIWALACAAGSAVLLLGLVDRPEREPQTRRTLALLEAHTRYEPVPVSTAVARVADWVAAVKLVKRPGDCVVCFPNQRAPAGPWGWRREPLSRALQARLLMPAYVVSDLALPVTRRSSTAYTLAWLALSLALIVAFLGVQAWIVRAVPGSPATVLLLLSVIVEFGLLAGCHDWLQGE